MACRTGDGDNLQPAVGGKVAFQHHVHIFSNRFRTRVPAIGEAYKREGNRVHRSRNGHGCCRRPPGVAGEACATPHEICDPYQSWHPVRIAVEDDGWHIEGHICEPFFPPPAKVLGKDDFKVLAEEMGIAWTCISPVSCHSAIRNTDCPSR